MKQHFITFESPGTLFHETTTMPIDSWDINIGQEMAHSVKERHGAIPFAFYFTTRSRSESDLDSKVVKTSGRFFLGGEVRTLRQIQAENDPKNLILISNMRANKWDRVVVNTNSWKIVQPLLDTDSVLAWKPRKEHHRRETGTL